MPSAGRSSRATGRALYSAARCGSRLRARWRRIRKALGCGGESVCPGSRGRHRHAGDVGSDHQCDAAFDVRLGLVGSQVVPIEGGAVPPSGLAAHGVFAPRSPTSARDHVSCCAVRPAVGSRHRLGCLSSARCQHSPSGVLQPVGQAVGRPVGHPSRRLALSVCSVVVNGDCRAVPRTPCRPLSCGPRSQPVRAPDAGPRRSAR
jgi:hypothetical protein